MDITIPLKRSYAGSSKEECGLIAAQLKDFLDNVIEDNDDLYLEPRDLKAAGNQIVLRISCKGDADVHSESLVDEAVTFADSVLSSITKELNGIQASPSGKGQSGEGPQNLNPEHAKRAARS